uniref:Mitochondrial import receptor subunit TOM20 homolog n=1 Tax=Lynx canadensis TaxID=61383 RepID=A0A667IQC8_LYNCA
MVGRNSAIAAGVCGALFIGYCIYFDRKRRSDPNFKNRLRERRKKQKLAKERAGLSKLPDLKDAEAVQKFFLEEIQLGEELLAQGEYEKGVDHLTNAIAVCGQPQQLLQVLQQTLPPPVFQMLLTKLPTISQRRWESTDAPPWHRGPQVCPPQSHPLLPQLAFRRRKEKTLLLGRS